METAFRTDRGKVRPHNEDNGAIFKRDDRFLFAVVADGMGGHKAGDVASKMATTFLEKCWDETNEEQVEDFEEWLSSKIKEANEHLFQYSTQNPDCQGMGTTVVAALCTPEKVIIGHVGDSRCYHIHQQELVQLTADHTLVHALVQSGQISAEEAEIHPRRHVLMRALGTEVSIEVDVNTFDWSEGDYLMLCSDGLTNKVNEQEILNILNTNHLIEEKADKLLQSANDAGGEDNITLALIQYPGLSRQEGGAE